MITSELLRPELGNHDCEYDSDGTPCNHCGRTAAEAIMYFERNIRQRSITQQSIIEPCLCGHSLNAHGVNSECLVGGCKCTTFQRFDRDKEQL